MLGGYWMIDVKSREEAIAWARKCPASENEIIEIRQVQEMADFSEEVQQATAQRRLGQARSRTRRQSSKGEQHEQQRYSSRSSRQQDQPAWQPGTRCRRPSGAPGSSRDGGLGAWVEKHQVIVEWAARSARPRRSARRDRRHRQRDRFHRGARRLARGRRKMFENHPHFTIFPGEGSRSCRCCQSRAVNGLRFHRALTACC